MGLDIIAYSGLKKVPNAKYINGGVFGENLKPLESDVNYDFVAFSDSNFSGRADELEDSCAYTANHSAHFRAGSYSRYNHWREKLAELAGYSKTPLHLYGRTEESHAAGAWGATGGPFWELINFSDCEGFIGTAVSKKLAADFAGFRERAARFFNTHDYEQYLLWQVAFETASNDGAVRFC